MKKWSVVAILAVAQFVMVLDSTVMNVSISTIVNELDTTVASMQSAITFYTLTMAAFMLIGAKLCARWGLLKAFVIGSVIYGIGSLITGLSPNITTLMIGWSLIEGLGAVLVIPAIAALVAISYKGKERVTAFAIIGAVSGIAAAAGPLIGGFVTTYFSWRYVFFAETIIMVFVLLFSTKFKTIAGDKKQTIDMSSALLSISGMVLLVYGLLQSKVWGWITPMTKPEIFGHEIAPLGISLVAYMVVGGLIILKMFYDRQLVLENTKGKIPLVSVSMLKIDSLRSGLSVLGSQYVIIAAVFFVVPIYLQMLLGYDALETGKKLIPLSIGIIAFSIIGTRLSAIKSPKWIVRVGQVLLLVGTLALAISIDPELRSFSFALAMFGCGAGLGLLASQLGNINMSAVDSSKSNEVGGLQGTVQNLGSSLGVALIGSIMIASLTTGFVNNVNATNLPDNIKTYITDNSQAGVQIVPVSEVEGYALSRGVSEQDAQTISDEYTKSQTQSLKESVFFLIIIVLLSLILSKHIPDIKPKKVIAKKQRA